MGITRVDLGGSASAYQPFDAKTESGVAAVPAVVITRVGLGGSASAYLAFEPKSSGVGELPPPGPEAIDDDWLLAGSGDHRVPLERPTVSVRTRHGRGTFRIPMPIFSGRGTVVASQDEDELLLMLLADET